MLVQLCRGGSTTLLGVDVVLGYPTGTAAALGLPSPPWSSMWARLETSIVDDERNVNNRFVVASRLNEELGGGPGPFWGCPPSAATATLTPTRPQWEGAVATWRLVEQQLRDAGHRPFSAWQLLGAGSVGSQSLVAIPVLERLRRRWPDRVEVWPFTTGLRSPALAPGSVVIAEIWPSLADVPTTGHHVRDARQVVAVARWLAELDRAGGLEAAFRPPLPAAAAKMVVDEEGWVLGVGTG